jgi:hypothetical protein
MKFKSALVTEASGSIGGMTASHNKGGLYLRARAIPTNPNSPQQQVVRGFVAQLAGLWSDTLTVAQRFGWDLYASVVPLPDPIGEPRDVGGLPMYIRSNVPRLQAGLARVDDAPTIFNLGSFTNPEVDNFAAATDEFDVSFSDTDNWVDEDGSAMLILSSPPQNQSINYYKGPYRFAGAILGDAITAPTSPATISAAFPFSVDQRVFVQIRITRADGRLILPFRLFGLGV